MFSLPAGITKLRALACLDVSGCPLNSLPTSLGRLQALRHLRLNGTNIMVGLMHIWEPLAKLPALESVEMRWVLGHLGICGLKGGGALVGWVGMVVGRCNVHRHKHAKEEPQPGFSLLEDQLAEWRSTMARGPGRTATCRQAGNAHS